MSSIATRSTSLGEVTRARSRHAGRRSTVTLTGDLVVEEPVSYHDGDAVYGGYRLHAGAG